MNVGNSRTPDEHGVVHRDCPEMSRKSKDVLELVRHNRMLRTHCLESELDINYAFKLKENIMKTYLRVPKNTNFEHQMNPLGSLGARLGPEH